MSHTNTETSLLDYFGESISVYTRQQAIDDGVVNGYENPHLSGGQPELNKYPP